MERLLERGFTVPGVRYDIGVDAIVGLIGGYIGTWIVGLIPGLAGLVTGGGGAYVGQGVTGLIGGIILTAIVGAIKNAVAK